MDRDFTRFANYGKIRILNGKRQSVETRSDDDSHDLSLHKWLRSCFIQGMAIILWGVFWEYSDKGRNITAVTDCHKRQQVKNRRTVRGVLFLQKKAVKIHCFFHVLFTIRGQTRSPGVLFRLRHNRVMVLFP